MADLKKRSIKATVWIYIGFAIGAFNMYLLTSPKWFSTDEFGLTRAMLEIGIFLAGLAGLGNTSFIIKFFPYYKSSLPPKRNDMLLIGLMVCAAGFALTTIGLIVFKPLVVQKFSTYSPLLVTYIYYLVPLLFFVIIYQLLEAYSFGFDKGLLTTFLKETVLRFYTTIIILAFIFFKIPFSTFILLFTLQYALLVIVLVIDLYRNNQLWIAKRFSTLTRRFRPKIISIMSFTYIPVLVGVIRMVIDTLILASKSGGLSSVAIVGVAAYVVAVMQAPFRSVVAITTPVLVRAWRSKNMVEINNIYKISSINLLSYSLFIFFLVWLNYENAIHFIGIDQTYLKGKWVFFILGVLAIIETGTGVNSQIIGTSNYWRFEMYSNIFLTMMIIPLSYFLTIRYGIIGPALGSLVSFFLFNTIRYIFLLKYFKLQPFTNKTLLALLTALFAYLVAYLLCRKLTGFPAILFSTLIFTAIYASLFYYLKISHDVNRIVDNAFNKVKSALR